ncbi:MAG: hypothetical protein JRJ86_17850 [Deltaproteobacteria bacterium]|nr:hypothetical protein [Deltaproteobacteria bacterium]MBW2118505.1 hypothetical protein [Deltaproteobacteria bacterium]MBW2345275.1 hypothetical protein [Deltaproteobacteria bacterium]
MEKKNILLKSNEYAGKYVALKSFKDRTVVAHGIIPKQVMKESSSKGYPDAVIVFVPENTISHVY